uniref:Phosphodiesterase n=1 Tax=Tetraselmis sp. GSL018 TaxID=582737 RepID=A0A061R9Q4_9CHLO
MYARSLRYAGESARIEVGQFHLSDPSSAKNVLAFGTSIIVLASLSDFRGSFTHLFQTLSKASDFGLFHERYVWIGAHQVAAGSWALQEILSSSESGPRIRNLFEQMLFMKPVFPVSDEAATSWDKQIQNGFPDLREVNTTRLNAMKSVLLPDFANAYDSLIWATRAVSYAAMHGSGFMDVTRPEIWNQVVEDVQVSCLTGPMQMLENQQRNASEHRIVIFRIAGEVHQAIGKIDVSDEVDWGDLTFEWRDGTRFPESIPNSEIATDGSVDAGRITMIAALCAAAGMALLLLLLGLGYARIRGAYSTIHQARLDLDPPVTKAASLLKEVSGARFITRSMQQRAVGVALSLMDPDSVFAPKLTKQSVGGNKEVLRFLSLQSGMVEGKDSRSQSSGVDVSNDSVQPIARGTENSVTTPNCPPWKWKGWEGTLADGVVDMADIEFLGHAGKDLFFDTLRASSITGGRPLLAVTMQCICSFDLVSTLGLDGGCLEAYMTYIEEGYLDVPYHNSTHAADVVSRTCAILRKDRIFTDTSKRKDSMMLLSVILASAVHDFRHPGLNNAFQIAADSDVSIEFNEQSVLENMSASRALAAMRTDGLNFLHALPISEQQHIHSTVIKLVLATDMSHHFEIVGSFKAKIQQVAARFSTLRASAAEATPKWRAPSFAQPAIPSKIKSSAESQSEGAVCHLRPISSNQAMVDGMDMKNKISVLEMVLKIADLGHMTTQFEQHLEWSHRLQEEFFGQGDQEHQMDLVRSPLTDRNKPGVLDPENQMTFADVVVVPMLEAWALLGRGSGKQLLDQLSHNQGEWAARARSPVYTGR